MNKQSYKRTSIDKEEYILNVGDLIYIPTGFHHEVVPLSPRLGISMSKE